jgi:hypothetical protein
LGLPGGGGGTRAPSGGGVPGTESPIMLERGRGGPIDGVLARGGGGTLAFIADAGRSGGGAPAGADRA